VPAPLNEVLAAGLIMLAGWKGEQDFFDPFCGSGTIAAEAALMATGTPAGSMRKKFSFENWKDFDAELLGAVKEKAQEQRKKPTCRIVASGHGPAACKYRQEEFSGSRHTGYSQHTTFPL
jgi:putative N6-adenine-specific DNA methylase